MMTRTLIVALLAAFALSALAQPAPRQQATKRPPPGVYAVPKPAPVEPSPDSIKAGKDLPPLAVTPPNPVVDAEYAIRWNAEGGAPATAAATAAILKLDLRKPPDLYDVRYVATKPQPDAPEGFTAILRERESGNRPQWMFKYRGERALARWTCPFPSPARPKAEIDISFTSANDVAAVHSYSCTVARNSLVPAAMREGAKGCTAAMTRIEVKRDTGDIDVEEWRFPDGKVVLEVSRSGAATPEAQQAFQREIVAALLAAGVKPLAGGMTDIAKACVPPVVEKKPPPPPKPQPRAPAQPRAPRYS